MPAQFTELEIKHFQLSRCNPQAYHFLRFINKWNSRILGGPRIKRIQRILWMVSWPRELIKRIMYVENKIAYSLYL